MVKKRKVKSILGEAAMLGVCVIFFIPFYYLLVNTFKPAREATVSPLSLPIQSFTLDLYKEALHTINFWSSFGNSILITVVSVVIIISIGSMASYAISRRKNRLTQFLFFYFLVGFMVPVQTTLIPLFNLMSSLKLQNSVAGMIVLYSSWCNFAMFMYQGFLGGVPKDLEEAALIDGCGPVKTLLKVMLPNVVPAIVTVLVFSVVWYWNDYYVSATYLTKNFPLSVNLTMLNGQLSSYSQQANISSADMWLLKDSILSCGCILVLLPLVIMYIFAQKQFTESIERTGIVG